MESPASLSKTDRASAPVHELVRQCVSKFDACSTPQSPAGDCVGMENRQADLRLWADGVGATADGKASLDWRFRSRPDDLMLVKSVLLMLGDFIDEYMALLMGKEDTDDAVQGINSAIENLALIGVAIRCTGKASRRRRVDMRFEPDKYWELRQHLECIILLRPSKSGLPEKLETTRLSDVQERLIYANLMRRHRFVIAQRRSQKTNSHSDEDEMSLSHQAGQDEAPQAPAPPADSKTSENVSKVKQTHNQKRKGRAAKTIAGLTEASTAEGTLQYGTNRKYVAGAARTQITAIAAETDFPKPPKIAEGRHIIKCPCCCQAFPVEEMTKPDKWRFALFFADCRLTVG